MRSDILRSSASVYRVIDEKWLGSSLKLSSRLKAYARIVFLLDLLYNIFG